MNDPLKTRQSLILRLRHVDDAAAWQEFVEIYQPLVFRIARSRGLQDADALDTTQEVLAKIAKAVNQWNPDESRGSFRGWLGTITRNLVIDFLRSKRRKMITSDDSGVAGLVDSIPDRSANLDDQTVFDLEHQRQVFMWAANRVKESFQPKSWQAFWMTAVENKSVDDVAEQLGLSKGAVYVARSRALAKLKTQVHKHLEEANTDTITAGTMEELK